MAVLVVGGTAVTIVRATQWTSKSAAYTFHAFPPLGVRGSNRNSAAGAAVTAARITGVVS